MKRISLLIVSMICLAFLVIGCSSAEKTSETETKSTTEENKPEVKEEKPEEKPVEEKPTEIQVKHQLGEVTVPINPKKVVVFDFAALDTLHAMGVAEIVGIPQNLPPHLAKFKNEKYEDVGSLFEPDFEKISNLQPDLIIVSARQQKVYEELAKIAPTLYFPYMGIDKGNSMDVFNENTKLLGQIFSKEDFVEEELTKINEALAQLNKKVTTNGENALVVLAQKGEIQALGKGSRFDIVFNEIGFKPADENIEVSTHGMNINFEYIVEKDPNYLFVVDSSGSEEVAKQLIENDLVKNTKAFKDGKIVYLDFHNWYISVGGLTSVAEMIQEVTDSVK